MADIYTVYHAPPNIGCLRLGQTLPSLLDEACDRHPNNLALNQWHKRQWQPLSNRDFRAAAEAVALGLLVLGLERGDRTALVMHSDVPFCIVDMGCLLAGIVDVPVDLTQTIENILFILQHAEAKALVISNLELLYQLVPYLKDSTALQTVIVAEVPEDWQRLRGELMGEEEGEPVTVETQSSLEDCLQVPQFLDAVQLDPPTQADQLPDAIQLLSLAEVRERGKRVWSEEGVRQLREAIAPQDLATLLYIASETKQPKGVMLSHENISADILASFSSYPGLATGDQEVALLFLPLTHIFARAFFYGHLSYGHSIYFSDPNHIIKHLKTVNPTIMITVPRLLEKVYERILEQGRRLAKFDRAVFAWALKLAQRYEVGRSPQKLYALQLKLADRLVFAKWRAVFGDRMKALISGGAALRPDLTQVFSAAGIPVLQGYGLTETSAVLCYNRGPHNRAGTVGMPIPGVELAIAPDGEVLVKAPFVMHGYYRDAAATQRVIDPSGWLHTGDLGEMSSDGFLTLTGVKKPLFKLSTGKYVSPLPLERSLNQSPLVAQAVIVGANHKFCGLLIFPNLDWLHRELQHLGVDPAQAVALQHPCLLARYQGLVDQANCHLPYWATVRKFKLIAAELTVDNHLLHPDGTLNRVQILEAFAAEIALLYGTELTPKSGDLEPELTQFSCLQMSAAHCPVYARSLTHY